MKVLILCGGYGSRLAGAGGRSAEADGPGRRKADGLAHHAGLRALGLPRFVLCLGFRSDLFKQYFLNLSTMLNDVTLDLSTCSAPLVHGRAPETEWRITLAETGLDSLTGTRVKRGGAFVPADDDIFAVTYGDGVCRRRLPQGRRVPPRARQAGDGDRRASARPVRRAGDRRRRPRRRVQREAAGVRGLDQRRLLRLLARACSDCLADGPI